MGLFDKLRKSNEEDEDFLDENEEQALSYARDENVEVYDRAFVNLIPESYREEVKLRLLQQRWISVGILVTAALVIGSILTIAAGIPLKAAVNSQLETNRKTESQLDKFRATMEAVDSVQETTKKLETTTGADLNWNKLFTAIQNALPSGTAIKSLAVNADDKTPDRSSSIRAEFVSDSPMGYADTLRALESLPGASNVVIGGMTASDNTHFAYTAVFSLDDTFRSNDLLKKGAK